MPFEGVGFDVVEFFGSVVVADVAPVLETDGEFTGSAEESEGGLSSGSVDVFELGEEGDSVEIGFCGDGGQVEEGWEEVDEIDGG